MALDLAPLCPFSVFQFFYLSVFLYCCLSVLVHLSSAKFIGGRPGIIWGLNTCKYWSSAENSTSHEKEDGEVHSCAQDDNDEDVDDNDDEDEDDDEDIDGDVIQQWQLITIIGSWEFNITWETG